MSELWKLLWENEMLPPGFRFHPTDEEFVSHYLRNYVLGIKDYLNVIPDVEDLFKWDPRELPPKFRESSIIKSKDPEWWFLSTLKRKSPNSDKFDRRASTGSWKITGRPKEIRARGSNRLIGIMRNLVFCGDLINEETNWVIHEYHIKEDDFGPCPRDQEEYVLCHLVNRQYNHTETSTNMETDLDFVLEESEHSFSEAIVQAKMRSLLDLEGPSPAATDVSLGDPRSSTESIFMINEIDPVDDFDWTEVVMSTSGGVDDTEDLLNDDDDMLYLDEVSGHSSEFEIESFFEQLSEHEGTPRAESEHAILKENRQAGPSQILQGYVVLDETRGFVEDNFQEQKKDPLSVQDSSTGPTTKKYPLADNVRPNCELQSPPCVIFNVKEGKGDAARAAVRRVAAMELHSTTREINPKTSTGAQLSRAKESNEKKLVTSHQMDWDGYKPRPPSAYLVNLVTGVVITVMILWLLVH